METFENGRTVLLFWAEFYYNADTMRNWQGNC